MGGIDCLHMLHSEQFGDGALIAAGSRDTAIYIWSRHPRTLEQGPVLREYTMAKLMGHRGWVWSLASEKDYRPQIMCSGSWDRLVKVWDVTSSENISNIK